MILQKEAKGIETNEELYRAVQAVKLQSNNLKNCYRELIEKVKFPKEDYFANLGKAMKIWVSYF